MPKKPRGFQLLDREARQRISSQGGRAAHDQGKAHTWTPEQAAIAGRKGGKASRGGRGKQIG